MVSWKANQLVICKDHYKDEFDFEEAVKEAIMLLLENEYIMTVQYDEPGLGIVAIEYEPNHPDWGCNQPYWLSPEEYEDFKFSKKYKEEDE